jgi:hypothetical protein
MGTEIVNWEERLASSAKEVAALERPSLSIISVRGGIISYMGQPIQQNKLDVVVLVASFQNRYYDKPFDPNKPENPVCFALSLTGDDMVPHDDSPDKQSETCSGCPMNEWGSDPKGGRGKACKAARRLAVIPANALEKVDEIAKAEMAMITLPVTSGKNWANYVNSIASQYQRPPWAVITEVRTEPDMKTQFQVKFSCKGIVENEALGAIDSRIESARTVLMTPYEENQQSDKPAAEPKAGRKY